MKGQGLAEVPQSVVGGPQVLEDDGFLVPVAGARLAERKSLLKALGGQGEDLQLGEAEPHVVVEPPCKTTRHTED